MPATPPSDVQDPAVATSGIAGLLRPRGIALLGVSGRADNLMARPLRYLVEHGFAGGIYPVNPKYAELNGLPCYPSLAEVPGPVDLVLVLVPAEAVEDAIRQAAAVGASALLPGRRLTTVAGLPLSACRYTPALS